MMIGMGTDFWGNAIFILPTHYYILESEWLDTSIKMIPLIFSITGATLALIQYLFFYETLFNLKTNILGRTLYTFLNRKWLFDKFYNEFVSQVVLNMAYKQTYQSMDRGLLEFLGPQGVSHCTYYLSLNNRNVEYIMFSEFLLIIFAWFLIFLIRIIVSILFIVFIDLRVVVFLVSLLLIKYSITKK
jgi:NADH-ubiquinone oxidoreductase chain 5